MELIGNSKIVDFFKKAIANNSLSHAYCLTGSAGIGKEQLARFVAIELLNLEEEKLENYPDYYYLTRIEDEKSGKLKKDISIKQIRGLKSSITKQSWLNQYKIIIIDQADRLNQEASNSLLKLLEEQTEKTIFFLLTTDENLLLPTIQSRCQNFYLGLVPDDEVIVGLEKRGYEDKIVKQAVKLACGRPQKAIELAEDPEKIAYYLEEYKRWQKIASSPYYERVKLIKDLTGKTSVVKIDKVLAVLEVWIFFWRGLLKKIVSGQNDALTARYDRQIIRTIIDRIDEAKMMLKRNVNPTLVLENILIKIDN